METVVPNWDSSSIWTSLLEILMVNPSTDSTMLSGRIVTLLAAQRLVSPVANVMLSSSVVKSTPVSVYHGRIARIVSRFTTGVCPG